MMLIEWSLRAKSEMHGRSTQIEASLDCLRRHPFVSVVGKFSRPVRRGTVMRGNARQGRARQGKAGQSRAKQSQRRASTAQLMYVPYAICHMPYEVCFSVLDIGDWRLEIGRMSRRDSWNPQKCRLAVCAKEHRSIYKEVSRLCAKRE